MSDNEFLSVSVLDLKRENLSLKSQLSDTSLVASLESELENMQIKNQKLNEELKLSITSKENIITELKLFQKSADEYENLKNNYDVMNRDNERLRLEVTTLSKEVSKLAGHSNLNQKIKLHARMKEENNKLKEQNYNVREELRKKTEKFDLLQKKFDIYINSKETY